jgi:hypothetical protein
MIMAIASHRAGRPSARAMLRCLGYSATIAIAACKLPTPQEREANWRASEARIAKAEAQRRYDDTYDHCLYRVTGPFAGASIEVMRECDRQARAASGMDARQGGNEVPPRSGDSPTAESGDAQ